MARRMFRRAHRESCSPGILNTAGVLIFPGVRGRVRGPRLRSDRYRSALLVGRDRPPAPTEASWVKSYVFEITATPQTPPPFLDRPKSWKPPRFVLILRLIKCWLSVSFISSSAPSKCLLNILTSWCQRKAKWWRSSIISAAQTETEDCTLLCHPSHLISHHSVWLHQPWQPASPFISLSLSLFIYNFFFFFKSSVCIIRYGSILQQWGGEKKKKHE